MKKHLLLNIKSSAMKKFFVYAAGMLAMAVCGCQEKEIADVVAPSEEITLDVCVPVSEMTRITDVGDESALTGIQAFVFRKDGSLDAWASSSGNTLSIQCTAGERDISVLVNSPEIKDITTFSALRSKVSLLSDNGVGSLVMSGTVSVTLSSSSSVTVPVSRKAARVSIERIVTDFDLEQYKNAEFKITGIYLVNVAGDAPYFGTGQPGVWYNRMENAGELPALLSSGKLSVPVTGQAPYEVSHHFYCYPNPTGEDISETTWSPRKTRLVVEAELDGVTCYYPMTMPVIESNHLYTVTELKITKPGSSSPDIPVVKEDVSFVIEVADWDEGYSGSFEI